MQRHITRMIQHSSDLITYFVCIFVCLYLVVSLYLLIAAPRRFLFFFSPPSIQVAQPETPEFCHFYTSNHGTHHHPESRMVQTHTHTHYNRTILFSTYPCYSLLGLSSLSNTSVQQINFKALPIAFDLSDTANSNLSCNDCPI